MVTRTRLNVTSYVNSLSFLYVFVPTSEKSSRKPIFLTVVVTMDVLFKGTQLFSKLYQLQLLACLSLIGQTGWHDLFIMLLYPLGILFVLQQMFRKIDEYFRPQKTLRLFLSLPLCHTSYSRLCSMCHKPIFNTKMLALRNWEVELTPAPVDVRSSTFWTELTRGPLFKALSF